MKVFNKKHEDISKKEGIMGENRIKTVDKAFEIIVDHIMTDTIANYYYLMQIDESTPFYIPNVEKIK